MLYHQTYWIMKQLEHDLEKALHIDERLQGGHNGDKMEITSDLREATW